MAAPAPAPAAPAARPVQAPVQAQAPAPVPVPPRVVLLLDAPTNQPLAGFFVRKGYSVEIVRDLRFCGTALLKSARFIVANPDPSGSPFYQKILITLRKMVPDRLFEQRGQDLLAAVKAKASADVQPAAPHPMDAALRAEAAKAEDAAAKAELDAHPQVGEQRASPVKKAAGFGGPRRSQSPDIKDEDEAAPQAEAGDGGGDAGESGEAGQMNKQMEEEAAGILESALAKAGSREGRYAIDDAIRKTLAPYVQVAGRIGELAARRESLLKSGLPEDAAAELRRQATALTKPQMPERVIARAKENEERAAAAKAEGKPWPPRKLPKGDAYDRVIAMGQEQDALLYEKAVLRFDLAQWFANTVVRDPLFKIFRATGVDADYLYGTLYFMMCLESMHGEILARHKELQEEVDRFTAAKAVPKKSGFSLFGKSSEPEAPVTFTAEEQKMREEASRWGFAAIQVDQDLGGMEPDLVDSYWGVYEQGVRALVEKRVRNRSFLRRIRAFVRFGLLCEDASMIAREQADALLALADDDCAAFAHEEGRTNIVYADEQILQTAAGILPPSFDEELELSGQGTPRYRYEKVLRRIHASEFKIQINGRELAVWQGKIAKQKEAAEAAEQMAAGMEKGSREAKIALNAARECKAEIARVLKIVEKFDEIVKTEQAALAEAKASLASIEYKPDPGELAVREAGLVRKYCKLLANRKEPFLPFLLRDIYVPGSAYDRKAVQEALREFEKSDVCAFSVDLANSPNPKKRVMVRSSPSVVVLPCLGVMGFCVTSSSNSETGRLVVPFMSPQQYPLPKMLVDMFSDFRYDTSKQGAGVDWMKSDTVVAGYAKVRWDYRKKSKDTREKCAIYNELPDRKNFRFHYRLFVESAHEGGKKLFYKCGEMYEVFVKYLPLPDGVQRVKKA